MRATYFAVMTAASLAATAATAQTKWDMPTGYAPSNFHTVNIEKFAESVKAATAGKLLINVHSNASLFKAPEIKRAVQTGQAQIGEVLMVLLSNENPMFDIDGLPFFATSYDAAEKLARVQRPYVEKLLEKQGIKLLFAVPWPPQGIQVNKPINSIKDMEGLTWRAYSKQTARIGELIKARPVTIQAAEVSQALVTGKVNSYIASAQSGVDYKMWEALTHFYDVQAWLPKNMIIVNKAAFDALDKATQDTLMAEARKAEAAGFAASKQTAEDTKKTLADKGVKVLPPSPALAAELAKIGDTMLAEWLKDAGPDGAALVADFRK
ncbi:MAG: TRAP transporter substrate-binding protein [Bradyrhizobium sp.]